MRWFFRDISGDPSEKEITQKDQFNNDEVGLAEALVRETIQNSSDAQMVASRPVRVRFAFVTVETESGQKLYRNMLDGLAVHLDACKILVPTLPLRILVVEDFETTGLAGSVETKDNSQFSGFWRRFGRSNKQGGKLGRWGLGKLVFTSASSIQSVFGLTRRAGEDCSWFMGQAVLKNHLIGSAELDSVGFWCRSDDSRPGLPTSDASIVAEIGKCSKLQRTIEPGLSLIIPWILPEIEAKHLIAAAIRNYYFPILTGRLVVEVDDVRIDHKTFDEVSASLPNDVISPTVLAFVRSIDTRRQNNPDKILPRDWPKKGLALSFLEQEIENLRLKFSSGELLMFRTPLLARAKGEAAAETYVDLFLQYAPGQKASTLVVRGSITVPGEGRKMALPDAMAALLADQELISRLLGDAENPAHTSWNERAEKLRVGWEGGGALLRQVRRVLGDLYNVLAETIERDDPDALVDFFSIPKRDQGSVSRPNKPSAGPPEDLPPAKPKPFQISRLQDGFVIQAAKGLQKEDLPEKISVRVAYDILAGNPFNRFSDLDFNFFGDIRIDRENVHCKITGANTLELEPSASDFRVGAYGFDPNRDLIVEAWS